MIKVILPAGYEEMICPTDSIKDLYLLLSKKYPELNTKTTVPKLKGNVVYIMMKPGICRKVTADGKVEELRLEEVEWKP